MEKTLTKKKKLTQNMAIVFPEDMKAKMIEEAKKLNISQGELVRQAVEQYLVYLDLMNEANNLLDSNDLVENILD